jgi:hypothetical protein
MLYTGLQVLISSGKSRLLAYWAYGGYYGILWRACIANLILSQCIGGTVTIGNNKPMKENVINIVNDVQWAEN